MDFLDAYPFTDGPTNDVSNPAAFDINNFGLDGCEESLDDVFEIFNEPANFDFQFRDGPYGVFDGAKPTGTADKTSAAVGQEKLAFTQMEFLPPLEDDGSDNKKAGATYPVKFKLFTPELDEEIIDARISVHLTSNLDGGAVEVVEFGRTIVDENSPGSDDRTFVVYDTNSGHYHFNWKTDKAWAGENVGLQLKIQVDDLTPESLPAEPFTDYLFVFDGITPLIVEGTGGAGNEAVTILVSFK